MLWTKRHPQTFFPPFALSLSRSSAESEQQQARQRQRWHAHGVRERVRQRQRNRKISNQNGRNGEQFNLKFLFFFSSPLAARRSPLVFRSAFFLRHSPDTLTMIHATTIMYSILNRKRSLNTHHSCTLVIRDALIKCGEAFLFMRASA